MFSQISKDSKYAQVGMKEGVRRHGDRALEALLFELTQLDEKETFRPLLASSMTKEERKMALNLLTIIKEKRCGKIKGRVVADGRKQKMYVSKEESSSPTIQLESLMMSLMIDAKENRDVATADIVGAYLLAEMQDKVIVKLKVTSVDVLCKANNKYKDFVIFENNTKVIYLRLSRALYGCVQSALLWYHTFVDKLLKDGFQLNKYDPCVANKTINGEQCTICWYVDDTKVSHKDPKVVDKVLASMEGCFNKMTIKRGKSHTFVGIDFTLNKNGTVSTFIKDYINECIGVFGRNDIKKKTSTPARHDLFNTNEKSNKIDSKRAEIFHHIVAKLLC